MSTAKITYPPIPFQYDLINFFSPFLSLSLHKLPLIVNHLYFYYNLHHLIAATYCMLLISLLCILYYSLISRLNNPSRYSLVLHQVLIHGLLLNRILLISYLYLPCLPTLSRALHHKIYFFLDYGFHQTFLTSVALLLTLRILPFLINSNMVHLTLRKDLLINVL